VVGVVNSGGATSPPQGVRHRRRMNRGALPTNLLREEVRIDVVDKICPRWRG
jgi:hypothetical protein